MNLKDLITQLQALYDIESQYADVMGEPEIIIDVFKKVGEHHFQYAGFSKDIRIDRSSDGVYPIINAFAKEEK
jgi:hypothetical protein